jgi:hypothetical protein
MTVTFDLVTNVRPFRFKIMILVFSGEQKEWERTR